MLYLVLDLEMSGPDPEWNEVIMRAKDFSAAAVLISAIISAVVGGLIFIPKLLNLI